MLVRWWAWAPTAVLLVAVCVAVLPPPASARVSASFKKAYTAVPGSCSADSQCELYHFCNADGVCESQLTQSRIMGRIVPVSTAVVAGIFGGIAAGLLCACGIFWCSPGSRCGSWGDAEFERSITSLMTGVICCVVVGLGLGLMLGLWSADVTPSFAGTGNTCESLQDLACEPYFCDLRRGACFEQCTTQAHCSLGAECSDGRCVSTRTAAPSVAGGPKMAGGRAAGIAIGGALAWFVVCCICTVFWKVNPDLSDYDWPCFTMYCACFGTFALALGLGLGLGLPTSPGSGIVPNTNTTCAGDRACAPYLCNEDAGACYTQCGTSSDCFSSFSCVDGACVRGSLGVEARSLSVGGVTGLTISVFVFLCVCLTSCCYSVDPFDTYDKAERCFFSTVCSLIWGLIFALLIGLLVGFAKKDVDFVHPAPVNGTAVCAQAEAVVCSPYFCDISSYRCRNACASDNECVSGTKCAKDGRCVDDGISPNDLRKSRATLPGWTITFIAFAAAVPFVTVCAIVFIAWHCFSDTDVIDATGYDLVPASSIGGIVCCLVVVLTVGIALGVTQRETPTAAEKTVAPHIARTFPTWFAVAVAMGAACGTCGLLLAVFRATLPLNWRAPLLSMVDSDLFPTFVVPSGCCMITTFCATLLCVGLGLGLHTSLVGASAAPVPGAATCVAPTDVACFPYFCDTFSGACYSSCVSSDECLSGYQCRAGQCAEPPPNLPLRPRRLAAVVTAAATLGAFALCFCFVSSTSGWKPRSRLCFSGFHRYRAPVLFFSSCCCAVFVGICVGVPMMMWHDASITPTGLVGAGAKTCHGVKDLACEPYLCDSITGSCFDACSSDRDCQDSYQCTGGQCTYASPDLARTIGLALILVFTVGLVLVCASFRVEAFYRNARRKKAAARQAEFLRRVREFQERQANIQPVVLNVDAPPDADPEYDPTVVTFAGTAPTDMDALAAAGVGDGPQPAMVPAVPETDELCGICYFAPSEVRFNRSFCAHGFCPECASSSLDMIINNDQFPARCPGCLAEDMGMAADDPAVVGSHIESGIIERLARRMVIAVDFARRFISLQLMKAFSQAEFVMCPSCSLLSVKPDWDASSKSGPARYLVTCDACETEYCAECLVFWFEHEGYTCEQYSKAKATGADRQTEAMIAATTKRCPTCGAVSVHWFKHNCHHISPGTGCLVCGTHYCYVCLGAHPCNGSGGPTGRHDMFCDDRGDCGCLVCPECQPGRPCPTCPGSCPGCSPGSWPAFADQIAARQNDDNPQPIPQLPPIAAPIPPPLSPDRVQRDFEMDLMWALQQRLEAPPAPNPELGNLLADLGVADVPPGFWDPVIVDDADAGPSTGAPSAHADDVLPAYQRDILVPHRLVIPPAAAGMSLQDHIRSLQVEDGLQRAPPAPPPLPPPNWRQAWRTATSHITAAPPRVVAIPAAPPPPAPRSRRFTSSSSSSASSLSDDAGSGVELEPLPPRRAPATLQLPGRAGDDANDDDDRTSPLYLRRGLPFKNLALTPESIDSPSVGDDPSANVFDFGVYPRTARESRAPVTARWLSPTSGALVTGRRTGGSRPRPSSGGVFDFDLAARTRPKAPLSASGAAPSSAGLVRDITSGQLVPRTPVELHAPRVSQFMAITGVDERKARNYLALFNYNLAAAVKYYNDVESKLRARHPPSDDAPPPHPPAHLPKPVTHHAVLDSSSDPSSTDSDSDLTS